MGEPYRTWAEIENLYPDQWVLLDRLKKGKTPDIVFGGHVIYHGDDPTEMFAVIDRLPRPFDIAHRYTGPITAENAFVWDEPR